MKTNKKRAVKTITTEELDQKFDKGEDVSDYFDIESATKTINVDLPLWAIRALDKEATRRGVARQALMKMWLVDRLDSLNEKQTA